MRYAVIVEEGEHSFGAYVPDLPGCIAVGETREEALRLIEEAIEFHLEGLKEDGQQLPEPSSTIEYVGIHGNYHVYQDNSGWWKWDLISAGNQVIASSSGAYRTRTECLEAIQIVKALSLAPVQAA